MSWNGTVRCGHCYEKGHNKRSCEKLKAQMSRRIEENPNDPYAKYFFERRNKAAGRQKKCGYCDTPGHTRPTCLELKHAKSVALKLCKTWRKKLVKGLMAKGIGVGTLIEAERWGEKYVGMVTKIRWNKLNHTILYSNRTDAWALEIQPVSKDWEQREIVRTFIPSIPDVVDVGVTRGGFEILSALEPKTIQNQVPEGYYDSADCISHVFAEQAKPQDRVVAWQVQDWCKIQGFYDD